MKKNKLIVVSGPTASGKTSLSIEIAKLLDSEVINFDSLLFYSQMDVGTAKPTFEEKNGIPHHLIDIRTINSPLDAAQYVELAIPLIQSLHKNNKIPVLTGGSGFYLQALLNGMYPSKTTSQEVLEKSKTLYESEGIDPFIEVLEKNDQPNFKKLHKNDHYRVRRAVEHYWSTGEAFSKSKESLEKVQIKNFDLYNWDICHIYLDIPKEEHLAIIYSRTKKMISNGLVEEVKAILSSGYSPSLKPLQSIGYKETIKYIESGELSLEELEERINISTRQLAKAQRTWFKTKEKKNYHPICDKNKIINYIKEFINESKSL